MSTAPETGSASGSTSGSGSGSNPGLLHSVKETISGAAQTVKELVTGHHDSDASLQQSDQQFTESADSYASEQGSGPSMREKLNQTLHTAKETVKEKLGLQPSDNQQDVDNNRDRQDRERMDTDYDEIPHAQSGSSLSTRASEQPQQVAAPSMREKLHQAKESVKDTLHQAKENVKEKLHMTREKDTPMASSDKDQAPKSAHQEFYESDPLAGFYDRAYHDNNAAWDLGRPQPSFVLFLSQQQLNHEGSVLEVGCGTGEHIIHMASVGHRRCVGIDLSDKALREAKHKASARGVGERVQFKKYDVRHLQELGSTFDIVIDVCFGHTIPVDMRQSYADQLRTVLNPGGRLYMFAYSGKEAHYAKDIYQLENKDVEMETGDDKTQTKPTTTTTSTKPLADDAVIVPSGITAEIARTLFSADKGWRVDHVIGSEMELAYGKTWPAMILCATFVGPKHPASVPAKARESTGLLQGVHTATGEGVLRMDTGTEKNTKQQQQQQQPETRKP